MTYFGFLARFLLPPLLILALLFWLDWRRGRRVPRAFDAFPALTVIAAHVVVAVAYTTPWDNYLVATRVWWYDPALVTDLIIGWVPIEEYTFFVLQTMMTGMWIVWLMKRLPVDEQPGSQSSASIRPLAFVPVLLLWVASVIILVAGWRPGTYLGLELVWALPPILLQLGFGADILWRNRRLVFWGLVPPTLYLWIADAIAIGAGTWTINPEQTTGLAVGVLPIEEMVFFLVTNVLVVFGVTLVMARESQARAPRSVVNFLSAFGRPQKSAQSA